MIIPSCRHFFGQLLSPQPKKDVLIQIPKSHQLKMQPHGLDIVKINSNNEEQIKTLMVSIVQNILEEHSMNFKKGHFISLYSARSAHLIQGDTKKAVSLHLSKTDIDILNAFLKNLFQGTDFKEKYKASIKPSIKIGLSNGSLLPHKDNASYNGKENDFTFVYPLMNIEMRDQTAQKGSPIQGTRVLPNTIKKLIGKDLYKKSQERYRGAVSFDKHQIPNEYFLSIPEGHGGIWRTSTQRSHPHDGDSVVHFTPSPETENIVRVIIIGFYNSK